MSSLLKYVEQRERLENGRGPVSFARSHIDNIPFRGPRAMLREEEYEQFTEVVRDGHVRVFDLSDDKQRQELEEVVDAASNGWWSIYRMTEHAVPQPDGSLKVFVYCVWSAPYRELAKHRLPPRMWQQG